MQFIDLAIETTTVLSVVFFSVQFVTGLTTRRRPVTAPAPIAQAAAEPAVEPTEQEQFDALSDYGPAVAAGLITAEEAISAVYGPGAKLPLIPFHDEDEPTQPLAALDPELSSHTIGPRSAAKQIRYTIPQPPQPSAVELRRQCQAAGIKWRGVKPGGKHLSKQEMLTALAARKA